MLPWVEDNKRLGEIVEEHKELCEYIVCHADVKGMRFNKWTKVEHGLDINALSSYRRVYAGHIHHRQETRNVLYTGTPYQMDRGDRDNQKGFYVLDLQKDSIVETFVANTQSPTYKKFDIYDVLEMSIDQVNREFNNAFVDIMIGINFVNKLSVTRFLDLVSGSNHRKIEFFTYVEETKDVASTQEFNPDEQFNVIDIFRSYLKTQEYSHGFKVNLAKKFIEIHNSVKLESVT
jgi:hypothetical protein